MELRFLGLMILLATSISATYTSAETVIFEGGLTVSGRIGELQANIFKFYGPDGYVAYRLSDVRDIKVDDHVSAAEQVTQRKNIERLNKLIDKEVFIKADFKKEVNALLTAKRFSQLDSLANPINNTSTKHHKTPNTPLRMRT